MPPQLALAQVENAVSKTIGEKFPQNHPPPPPSSTVATDRISLSVLKFFDVFVQIMEKFHFY